MKTPSCRSLALLTGLTAVVLSASAAPVTFYIDSSQSTLTLSGSAFGLPYTPQSAGSLSTRFSGTITAELSGGVLTFSGGSSIAAELNPAGPFITTPNTLDGPANYGVTGSGFITGFGFAVLNGAYRNLVFDITTGTAQDGAAASTAGIYLTAGVLDYGATLNGAPYQSASSSLVGKGGINLAPELVTLTGTTLTLPIHINTGLYSNRIEDYAGTIVAVIPEPGVLAFAGLALALFVARRRS